ncbi:putative porin [Flavobacterium sp. CS20]|uniref:putative porin n=1 Tax=Flavobacterium sp. CS20 TaxID=2775246 RepID=UPI001B39EE9B|nr:putative porin [Flavobacterium sp. CS20]QTY26932.1 putative porin [Flavobacterium sp. CS20]
MKYLFFFIGFICITSTMAQVRELRRADSGNRNMNRNVEDAQSVKETKERPPIDQYKIITSKNDTIIADTSLTIQKVYKYNYLRKDDFELLPFHNIGQTYNSLGYSFDKVHLRPQFGAQARRFYYLEAEDINYFYVPTPYTDLYFKTTFEQGQNLDASFTSNFTKRFNFYIAYKGLRSLGKYRHSATSNGHFRIGVAYSTKNDRYYLKTHFTSQDFTVEENGGLTSTARQQFVNGDSEFDNRPSLDVQFQDAENKFVGRRFYVDHFYKLRKGNDSTQNGQIKLKHQLFFKDKTFRYTQTQASDLFGSALETQNLNTEVQFQDVTNTLGLSYQINPLGVFGFNVSHSNYNYGYQSVFVGDQGVVPNRLKGDILVAGGSYSGEIGAFKLQGDVQYNFSGDFDGNYIKTQADYQFSKDLKATARLNINSHAPNYNKLLHQSDYKNYNWFNDFDNVKTQYLQAEINSEKFGKLDASITQIQDYAYFGFIDNPDTNAVADSLVRPFQSDTDVRYLKLKFEKTLRYGKFSLANTIMYQNVLDGEDVFRVPDFVTRQSLFYTDRWFKKALFLQTGFNFKYFTGYNANAYDPVLSEFVVQNFEELDDFFTVDFFFNMKVRQARIYLKYENLTTLFETNTSFSAPYYPYRDAVIRFGLVWNFFL